MEASSSFGSSTWGCGKWLMDFGEFLEVVETRNLMCHHDLTLAACACRSWRSVLCGVVWREDFDQRLPCLHEPSGENARERNALECACRRGSVSVVRHLVDLGWDPAIFPRCVECVAMSGSVRCADLLLRDLPGSHCGGNTLEYAASSESLDLVRFLHSQCGCPPSKTACDVAAGYGQLEVLRYLHEQCRCPWDCSTCAFAVNEGKLECLRYLRENGAPFEISMAGRVGPDVLEYLLREGFSCSEIGCASIAAGGHLDLLRRFHEECRVPWYEETCARSARAGSVDCLRYAHENGCPWNISFMCEDAIAGGSLECLKYCLDHGCDLTDRRFCAAAAGVSLELLRFVHEQGGAWDEFSCIRAAASHRLDILRYLHENGCPWGEVTSVAAAVSSLRILRYCLDEGCPWDQRICHSAARNRSSSSCLAFVFEKTCHFCPDQIIPEALMAGSVVCVKYCHGCGSHWSPCICAVATRGDQVEVLRYVRAQGCPWDENTLVLALERNSPLCFAFALQNEAIWKSLTLEGFQHIIKTTAHEECVPYDLRDRLPRESQVLEHFQQVIKEWTDKGLAPIALVSSLLKSPTSC